MGSVVVVVVVLEELATHEAWRGVKFGLASRTDCVEDAFALMKLIQVTPDLTVSTEDVERRPLGQTA